MPNIKTLLLTGFSLAAVVLLVMQLGPATSPAASPAAAPSSQPAGLPKLMDVGAKTCIPCKMMAPILDELKKDYAGRLDVEFIDVSIKENLPRAWQYGIAKIPTQVLLDAAGKELWRHEGFISKADILAKWKELKFDVAAAGPTTAPGNLASGTSSTQPKEPS
jgi:thioredoxin 1